MTGPAVPSAAAALRELADLFLSIVFSHAGSRRRIQLYELEDAFDEAAPELTHRQGRRARLALAIDQITATGQWAPSKSIDRAERPHLPAFVVLLKNDPTRSGDQVRARVWRPELAWATTVALTAAEDGALGRIQEWLRTANPSRVVPHRERSYEIFGDEKALDRMMRQRLFDPGRLTLDMLVCRWFPPPIAWRRISDANTALVIENAATYTSVLSALDGRTTMVGVVAYGAGRMFAQSVGSLAAPDVGPVATIRYFGDLDADGLAIPTSAIEAAHAVGLPAPTPAAGLWRLLTAVAAAGPSPHRVAEEVATELAEWLPADLQARAVEVLLNGERLAQEAVGADVLAANDGWRLWE